MSFSDSVQIPLTDLKISTEIRFFRVCLRLSLFKVMLLSLATILWALSCIDFSLDLAVSPKRMYTGQQYKRDYAIVSICESVKNKLSFREIFIRII